MKYLVQKFGGSSLATPTLIRRVAERVLEARRAGFGVIVVVSAMERETDRLLNLCSGFTDAVSMHTRAEIDVVASTGETVSAALTALAIQNLGGRARSFLGSQLPILTDDVANEAEILSINTAPLMEALERGEIPVVAGFQGTGSNGRITTLGRGGSDTTAVAIAAAIPGTVCEIYTDVDGIFTADPRCLPHARRLSSVSYKFMIEASTLGAKVMHDKSVILGLKYGVPIKVRSSFQEGIGSEIGKEETHSRCVTVDSKLVPSADIRRVSIVGDFIEKSAHFGVDARKILVSNGVPSGGINQRPWSLTSFVNKDDVQRAVQIFHKTYVEQICN